MECGTLLIPCLCRLHVRMSLDLAVCTKLVAVVFCGHSARRARWFTLTLELTENSRVDGMFSLELSFAPVQFPSNSAVISYACKLGRKSSAKAMSPPDCLVSEFPFASELLRGSFCDSIPRGLSQPISALLSALWTPSASLPWQQGRSAI